MTYEKLIRSNKARATPEPALARPRGLLLLLLVSVLCVIVLSAVESGKIAGANYGGIPPIPGLNFTWGIRTVTVATGTPVTVNGTMSQFNSTSTTYYVPTAAYVGIPPIPLFAPLLALPWWILTSFAAIFFAAACFLVIRLRAKAHTVGLEGILREMEEQQNRVSTSWFYRLRNRALLRYYLLMVRACSMVGIQETTAETPLEYVQRVSSLLKVDAKEAAMFAAAVNRCRYGVELSEEEAGEASVFMRQFTDMVRRKTVAT